MTRRAKDGAIQLDNMKEKARRIKEEKEAQKERRAQEIEAEQQRHTGKKCPLKARNLNDACYRDCALFDGNGCALGGAEHRETEGMYCPIVARKCADSCALYLETGCTIRPVRS